MVYFTFRLRHTQGRRPSIYWLGSWVAPRTAWTKSEYLSTWRTVPEALNLQQLRYENPASWICFAVPSSKALEKPIFILVTKECWVFHGTQSLIIDFTRWRHWFLLWAKCIQSKPSHPVSIRHVLTYKAQ